MDSLPSSREQRFRDLYRAAYPDLLRFVRRRLGDETDPGAEDVVAEVMLVAWRRLDDVPTDPSDARAWLFGVARHTMANTRRRAERRGSLAVRLAADGAAVEATAAPPDDVEQRLDVAAAWATLRPAEQEAIALSVLDGLTGPEAARLLGITATAYRLRLSRARRTLRRRLEGAPVPSPHEHPDPERSIR